MQEDVDEDVQESNATGTAPQSEGIETKEALEKASMTNETGKDNIAAEATAAENEQTTPYSEEAVCEMNAWAEMEFKELAQQYEDVPMNFNELMALPEGDKIAHYLEKGLSIAEAYTVACAKRLMESVRGVAKQAAISGIYSKSHLAPMGGSVADEVAVPSEVMNVYHKMFPKMSDAEIRAEYKKQSDN
ncbi:MAG: hypothetical protein RR234_07595 [Christensenella sp.]